MSVPVGTHTSSTNGRSRRSRASLQPRSSLVARSASSRSRSPMGVIACDRDGSFADACRKPEAHAGPDALEKAQRTVVVALDVDLKGVDSLVGSAVGQRGDQPGAKALSLPGVGDDDRKVRLLRTWRSRVLRHAADPATPAGRGRLVVVMVDAQAGPTGHVAPRNRTEDAPVDGSGR